YPLVGQARNQVRGRSLMGEGSAAVVRDPEGDCVEPAGGLVVAADRAGSVVDGPEFFVHERVDRVAVERVGSRQPGEVVEVRRIAVAVGAVRDGRAVMTWDSGRDVGPLRRARGIEI